MELRAPVEGRAAAAVIEARLERGLGPVATVIVKRGTLRVRGPRSGVVGLCRVRVTPHQKTV